MIDRYPGTDLPGAYRKLVDWRPLVFTDASSGIVFYLVQNGGLGATTTGVTSSIVHLDPADYALPGMDTKYRVKAVCMTNGTAPAVTFTAGLYPITAVGGAADVSTLTGGTVTTGSTVAFASPAANTPSVGNSGDFAAPAAGFFALGVLLSGTPAADARGVVSATLEVRNV